MDWLKYFKIQQAMKPQNSKDKKWQWNLHNYFNSIHLIDMESFKKFLKPHFEASQRGMMLNTDMELAYDIDVDNYRGTQCSKNGDEEAMAGCKRSTSYDTVVSYARVSF